MDSSQTHDQVFSSLGSLPWNDVVTFLAIDVLVKALAGDVGVVVGSVAAVLRLDTGS